ncbi:hypothetical protein E2C01_099259 [Portunus trituberculatus]|uniref:Uncharacterized protein n=1 Tax=Portunus trituberculatus TaxID=210409 RepID=A0A5B7KAI3_PORTR|nr:hypothetical protein [Portunus trituberculatus]
MVRQCVLIKAARGRPPAAAGCLQSWVPFLSPSLPPSPRAALPRIAVNCCMVDVYLSVLTQLFFPGYTFVSLFLPAEGESEKSAVLYNARSEGMCELRM